MSSTQSQLKSKQSGVTIRLVREQDLPTADRIIDACQEFAAARGASSVDAGVNLARLDAYREMLDAGFCTSRQGVVMERNAEPDYNRPEVFLIDDWR